MHQMVPDIVIGNEKFLTNLSEKERKIFDEGFNIISKVQRAAWGESVKKSIQQAKEMNVQFFYPNVLAFQEKVLPLHEEVLKSNPKLEPIYNKIQDMGKNLIGGEINDQV